MRIFRGRPWPGGDARLYFQAMLLRQGGGRARRIGAKAWVVV